MKTIIYLFLLLFTAAATHAQQVIATSGSSNSIPGYTVDWTLGEPVIETFTGSAFILTQGFHQSKLLVTSFQALNIPGLDIRVFPIPVSDKLMIEVRQSGYELFSYELTDISGRKMVDGKLYFVTAEIDMSRYAPGIWLLRVFSHDIGIARTYRIIKE